MDAFLASQPPTTFFIREEISIPEIPTNNQPFSFIQSLMDEDVDPDSFYHDRFTI